jgi:tRNA(Ile)-lysidine synthase
MKPINNYVGKFQKKILDTILANNLIEPGEGVVAGVSGGTDSVCLIHVLSSLRSELGMRLHAVHVNHMLRGGEADADEEYTVRLCMELKVPLHVLREDVAAAAAELGISVEEAGREIRYSEFNRHAEASGATKIAVAHNRNDQAETVMLNIIRGTGTAGLCGMEYIKGNIIRPLLSTDREEIEQYCREAGLSPRTDSTNLTPEYTRNKVRLGLFPYIDGNYGADIVSSLCRLAENAAVDNRFMEKCASEAYGQILRESGEGFVRMDIAGLRDLDPAIRMRVFRQAAANAAGSAKGIGSVHYRALTDLVIKGATGTQAELPRGIRASVSYGTLTVSSAGSLAGKERHASEFSRQLAVPGTTAVPEIGAELTASVHPTLSIDKYKSLGYNPYVQYFDYDLLKKGIHIRNRRTGDVFKPFGSSGTKKLKEFFIDSRIPREERSHIPLICRGNETVWVIGYKISDKFKVTENTKKVLKIEFVRRGHYNDDEGH